GVDHHLGVLAAWVQGGEDAVGAKAGVVHTSTGLVAACAATRLTSSARLRSAGTVVTVTRCRARSSSASASRRPAERATSTRLPPRSASWRANSAPSPEDAPVTRDVVPVKSKGGMLSAFSSVGDQADGQDDQGGGDQQCPGPGQYRAG